jgi:hypothetical protein
VVEAPIGIEVIKQTKNAITYLGREQASRTFKPNPAGLLPPNLLKDATLNHKRNVQLGSRSQDRGLGCPIRDSYSVREHRMALKATWMQPYSVTSPYIREHFCLSIRHSMLLRDEDLRRLNLSDMFMEQLPKRPDETQGGSMLVFSMWAGKTNQNHRQEYGCAIRHSDVRRCSIGALAFYLFDRFHKSSFLKKKRLICTYY